MKVDDILETGTTLKRSKEESRENFISRINHISLTLKKIDSMDGIQFCKNLKILDLCENKISNISHLKDCKMLTNLYLQNNCIQEISGLDDLPLKVLNLSCNSISHVSGLDNLKDLEILTLDQQNITNPMTFDPDSLEALQSLKYLSLIQCQLINIETLSLLQDLRNLNLVNNNIDSLNQLELVVSSCKKLKDLTVTLNPISSNIRLFERLAVSNESLETINDRKITQNSRIFMKNKMKIKKSKKTLVHSIVKTGRTSPKPLPHLPPYATQYR